MHRVLIIDDDATVRATIRGVLEGSDLALTLFEAADGREGLERARALPDLSFLIIDFNMPEMNGLALIRRLLDDERFRATPIMLYTTETDPALVAEARALSRTIRWVIKPLKAATFVLAVKGCLGLRPAVAAPAKE